MSDERERQPTAALGRLGLKLGLAGPPVLVLSWGLSAFDDGEAFSLGLLLLPLCAVSGLVISIIAVWRGGPGRRAGWFGLIAAFVSIALTALVVWAFLLAASILAA